MGEISLTKDTVECVFFNVSYLKFVKACDVAVLKIFATSLTPLHAILVSLSAYLVPLLVNKVIIFHLKPSFDFLLFFLRFHNSFYFLFNIIHLISYDSTP